MVERLRPEITPYEIKTDIGGTVVSVIYSEEETPMTLISISEDSLPGSDITKYSGSA